MTWSDILDNSFAIFVAVYLMTQIMPMLRSLQKTLTVNTIVLAKAVGVDYAEAKRLAGFDGSGKNGSLGD